MRGRKRELCGVREYQRIGGWVLEGEKIEVHIQLRPAEMGSVQEFKSRVFLQIRSCQGAGIPLSRAPLLRRPLTNEDPGELHMRRVFKHRPS